MNTCHCTKCAPIISITLIRRTAKLMQTKHFICTEIIQAEPGPRAEALQQRADIYQMEIDNLQSALNHRH